MSTTVTMTAPRETPRTRVDATLGMLLFIGSWSMAFGALLLAFFVLRQRQPTWPPQGVALPSFPMAAAATGVLVLSSVVLARAVARLRAGRPAARAWSLALLLGLAFAALQTWLWFDLLEAGRGPTSGTYESLFYGLTWFHAAHVACGLVGLLWVLTGLLTGTYGAERQTTPRNVALFWHFVDVVWIVLFVSLFVL